MSLLRRAPAVAGVLALLPLLVGCGLTERGQWRAVAGESNGVLLMTPKQALGAAHRSMTGLSDAVYRGTARIVTTDGSERWRLRMTSVAGGACELGFRSDRGSFWMRHVDGSNYLKGTPKLMRREWGYTQYEVELMRGVWIQLPPGDGLPVCGLDTWAPRPGVRGRCDAAGLAEVDGQPARRFEEPTDPWQSSWVEVATRGEPWILAKAGGLGGEDRFDVQLAGTDTGARVEEPPPSRVIDPGFEGGGDGAVPIVQPVRGSATPVIG